MSKIEFGGNTHYSQGGYDVTVGHDGAILVAPGDWLSKYSMAIYGDFDHVDRFLRPEGSRYKEIENYDLIHSGETLYHKDVVYGESPVDDAPVRGQPVPNQPPVPKIEFVKRGLDFLNYLGRVICPFTDWQVVGTAGVSVGIDTEAIKIGIVGSLLEVTVQRPTDVNATRLRGGTVGGTIGVDWDFSPISFSIAPPDFWSVGVIAKAPMAGATLSAEELEGQFVTMEFSGSCVWGLSLTLILFGPGLQHFASSSFNPASVFLNTKAALITLGTKVAGPDLSYTASGGYIRQW